MGRIRLCVTPVPVENEVEEKLKVKFAYEHYGTMRLPRNRDGGGRGTEGGTERAVEERNRGRGPGLKVSH
jgi:hypothetical protein